MAILSVSIASSALRSQGADFLAASADNPILARPFFNTQGNAQAAMLVAHPALLVGTIGVVTSTEFQGAEALYRQRIFVSSCARWEFIAGYRYLQLDENLRINQSARWTAPQGQIVVGTTQRLFDEFGTQNYFHGGQIGLAYREQMACWTLEAQLKLALGNSHSQVAINGRTTNTVPQGGSATFVGGLLAQETNIGRYEQDTLGFVPELTLSLRRDVTCNLQASVGYNLLYWLGTARPGDQIDPRVSQFPPEPPAGARRPAFDFQTGGFLAQGLQFGLEYHY